MLVCPHPGGTYLGRGGGCTYLGWWMGGTYLGWWMGVPTLDGGGGYLPWLGVPPSQVRMEGGVTQGKYPPSIQGRYPPPPRRLATRWAVCLLRSRRRTFLSFFICEKRSEIRENLVFGSTTIGSNLLAGYCSCQTLLGF